MLLYRYQHKDSGQGPYHHYDINDIEDRAVFDGESDFQALMRLMWRPTHVETLPSILIEHNVPKASWREWHSACASRQDLADYFRGYGAMLRRLGFRIVAVQAQADDILYGEGQVAFRKD